MTTVVVRCPECDEVAVPISQVLLRPAREVDGHPSAIIQCPGCYDVIEKPLSLDMTYTLLQSGAHIAAIERVIDSSLPPLNPDDLLDFHLALEDDNRLEAWIDAMKMAG